MAVAMANAASAINTASNNDSGLDEAMSAEGANARRCTRHGANAVAELHTDKHKLGRRDGAQRIEFVVFYEVWRLWERHLLVFYTLRAVPPTQLMFIRV